jgi:hypothetical protein
MTITRRSQEMSEMSVVIGELRSFATQQVLTNTHVVEQLKNISDRLSSIGETGVILAEYRNTLHERFGKIHETLGDLEAKSDQHTSAIHQLQITQTTWQSNIKLIIAICWVIGTIASAIITNFGGTMLRAMWR